MEPQSLTGPGRPKRARTRILGAVAGVFGLATLAVSSGTPVEPRTGMALAFRFAVWTAPAALSAPQRRP